MAAALVALAEARKYAAQFEATSFAQKAAEQKLIAEIGGLRDELVQTKSSLATARDEVDNRQQLLTQAEQSFAGEAAALREKVASLEVRIKQAEVDAADQRDAIATLNRKCDELRGRAESTERSLAAREDDAQEQKRRVVAAERANQEAQAVAESVSRRLRAEKELRAAAEQQVEQLRKDLKDHNTKRQLGLFDDGADVLFDQRTDLLAAELRAIRHHSAEIDAEREFLAARILKLMAPGQYLEHAAIAGYDVTQDPLIRLKREEIRVENRYYAWQVARDLPRRARRFDPQQTLDEQAYAGAMSLRWRLMDRPHQRQKAQPKWVVIGHQLDAENEQFGLTLTRERIGRMLRQMGEVW